MYSKTRIELSKGLLHMNLLLEIHIDPWLSSRTSLQGLVYTSIAAPNLHQPPTTPPFSQGVDFEPFRFGVGTRNRLKIDAKTTEKGREIYSL